MQGKDRKDQCYIPYSPRFLGIQRDGSNLFHDDWESKSTRQSTWRGGGHIEHHTEKKSG
jgi:hypothetical protein